jgi:hypothetical protein
MTFYRQVTDEQLAQAKVLVEGTDKPIAHIAREVGMSKGSLWRYVHKLAWNLRGRSVRESRRAIPDWLPYWRFRVYKKSRGAGLSREEALASAKAATR